MRGRLALVGSGEYTPAMQDVEDWLLDGRPRRYVQLATAAAPEGERTLDYWWSLGADAAARLDVEQVVVDVRVRADADNPALAAQIAGAGLVYLSGGNPAYLNRTLQGSAVWRAILDAWRGGASLAGCSAGAVALGGLVTDYRRAINATVEGLAVVPTMRVIPHFDRLGRAIPDMALRLLLREGYATVGIDEDTALLAQDPRDEAGDASDSSDLWSFRSRGVGSAWRLDRDRRHRINAPLRLPVAQ